MTSFWSVTRPGPFAQTLTKISSFPFSQERISCFYSEFLGFILKILKKEERVLLEWAQRWFHYRLILHRHAAFLIEEAKERWELLVASVRGPWPFWRQSQHPSLLFLSPALRSLWGDEDKDNISLPQVLAHSAWWCPNPRGPGGPCYHFLPQTGSPLRPVLSWVLPFRVKKKFRAIEWWWGWGIKN